MSLPDFDKEHGDWTQKPPEGSNYPSHVTLRVELMDGEGVEKVLIEKFLKENSVLINI